MKKCTVCHEEKELSEFYKKYNKPRALCKECSKKKQLKYKEDNYEAWKASKQAYNKSEKGKMANKKYYEKNYEKIVENSKIYKKTDRAKEVRAKWREANRKTIARKRREYRSKQKLENPLFVVKRRLRARINQAFSVNKWNKPGKTAEMLGCDFETAFKHIESQFTEGMSWENRHLWHIDHIQPLASATTEEELIRLCHYTNLQPLWAEDNLRKGDKWDG